MRLTAEELDLMREALALFATGSSGDAGRDEDDPAWPRAVEVAEGLIAKAVAEKRRREAKKKHSQAAA